MFSSSSTTGQLEAFALTYIQPGSALTTDDDPSFGAHGLLATALNAPPATHWSRDRTRRLSRTPTTHTLTSSTKSKAEPSSSTTASQYEMALVPLALQKNTAENLRTEPVRLVSSAEQAHQHKITLVYFITLCCVKFAEGWNDGSYGPLLPAFQHHYNGFMLGAIFNIYLDGKIGFGKNAQANGFVSGLSENMEAKLGVMHAMYGLGAFISPFVATHFSAQPRWTFHYLVSASITGLNITAQILIFRFKRIEVLLKECGQAPQEQHHNQAVSTAPRPSTFRQVFGLPAVHILTLFSVIYIGVEVTLGGAQGQWLLWLILTSPAEGWIVTFVIRERGGGRSSGYISSGFFGGIMLGRIGLLWLNKLVGEYKVVVIYTVIAVTIPVKYITKPSAIRLELTVWFVPSIIENAVAISLIGLVLGPIFPLVVSHSSKVLPRWLMTVSIGWITGMGMVGSAALPFLTGLLSSRFGIKSLQPLMISMMAVMLVVWFFVPRSVRRVD
ncbi:hypothetical protein DXG01_002718 [Tephrocybe rancida]|nr:hypothetical protein DXG01_002718 [Tephrocybe rancida]